MAGIDAQTGKLLTGIDHVLQSITKILTTGIGERVMREWVGSPGTRLLGRNLTERTILLWWTITYTVITVFEPRFRVRRFFVADANRLGETVFDMEGEYRLYAHMTWEQARVYVVADDAGVVVRAAE